MNGRFTTGEKRGLIALLIIIAILLSALAIQSGFFTNQSDTTNATESTFSVKAAVESMTDTINSKTIKAKRTKKAKKTSAKPTSGRQRDFLNEPIGTN